MGSLSDLAGLFTAVSLVIGSSTALFLAVRKAFGKADPAEDLSPDDLPVALSAMIDALAQAHREQDETEKRCARLEKDRDLWRDRAYQGWKP